MCHKKAFYSVSVAVLPGLFSFLLFLLLVPESEQFPGSELNFGNDSIRFHGDLVLESLAFLLHFSLARFLEGKNRERERMSVTNPHRPGGERYFIGARLFF